MDYDENQSNHINNIKEPKNINNKSDKSNRDRFCRSEQKKYKKNKKASKTVSFRRENRINNENEEIEEKEQQKRFYRFIQSELCRQKKKLLNLDHLVDIENENVEEININQNNIVYREEDKQSNIWEDIQWHSHDIFEETHKYQNQHEHRHEEEPEHRHDHHHNYHRANHYINEKHDPVFEQKTFTLTKQKLEDNPEKQTEEDKTKEKRNNCLSQLRFVLQIIGTTIGIFATACGVAAVNYFA